MNTSNIPSPLLSQVLPPHNGASHNPIRPRKLLELPIDVVVNDRRRPPGPKSQPSYVPVLRPQLSFADACPQLLRDNITSTFHKVEEVGKKMGLGGASPKAFAVHYIDRHQWKRQQSTMDREIAKQFPMSGLRAMWTRLTRWLSRQTHAWTTSIYFEREAAGDIYIIAENFLRQSEAEQNRGLAEVLVRSLQRATYPAFFKGQQETLKQLHIDSHADARLFSCKEAVAEINVRLCLDALQHQDLVLADSSKVPARLAFWRHRPSKEAQRVFDHLRAEPEIDSWFRTLFNKPIFTRFLFQKGDEVEISDKAADENEALLRKLRSINPYGAPLVKRSSELSR
jgi:hypothetical protein